MYDSPNYFAIVFGAIVVFVKALSLGWLLGQGIYDPSFFTYFTYTLLYSFYTFAFISYSSVKMMQFVYTFLLVPMYGIVTFVCFAIVIIVACNDWILVRTTILGGTDRKIGDVHTGDFVLHYLPAIGLSLYIMIHHRYIGISIANYWRSFSKSEKISYIFYLYLSPLLVLLFYMAVMPFDKNYPTHLNGVLVIVLVSCLSVLIQTLIILIAFFSLLPSFGERHKLVTPTGKTRKHRWNQTMIFGTSPPTQSTPKSQLTPRDRQPRWNFSTD
jgi:hypothetical protein